MLAAVAAMGGDVPETSAVHRCERFGEEFYAQAERDFSPFHGLTATDAARTELLCRQQGEACFVVQVRGGRLFVAGEQAGFQSRHRITMAFLQRVSAKFGPLPDAEFVVDTSDGYMHVEAPLFVIAKFPQSVGGILYPDFSSYAWPESECPSEPAGAHTWNSVVEAMCDVPAWAEKDDTLFWRGAATSVYRRQVLPQLVAASGADVSFMEWVWSVEGRQVVKSGSCVPLAEWCRHRFLANLPGNTMALALKYRLLCGSVIISPPLWYHEWYYSQLQPGVHFVEVDPRWVDIEEALVFLRAEDQTAQAVAANAARWARLHLSEDAFDCYWLRLIELAHRHFPAPSARGDAVPMEHLMLRPVGLPASGAPGAPFAAAPDSSAGAASGGQQSHLEAEAERMAVDVVIVIPARAADAALMQRARDTWLSVHVGGMSQRHYFVIATEDPQAAELLEAKTVAVGASGIAAAARAGDLRSASDLLFVECAHGYTMLLQKMVLAYRALLARHPEVKFFVRADVDSVVELPVLLPLLPHASRGDAVVPLPSDQQPSAATCAAQVRWHQGAAGALVCQTQCSVDRRCSHFAVDEQGNCDTFWECPALEIPGDAAQRRTVYKYKLRDHLASVFGSDPAQLRMPEKIGAFILGTVLYGNDVFMNDTYNPQWNNPGYRLDLGLRVYPPYPEASGYAISAPVAAFLAAVGAPAGPLSELGWRAWAIEDAALGTALAGLNLTWLQLPVEVRQRMRVVRVRH